MSLQDLEQTLRDLDRVAAPVRRRADRETWRFEHGGRPYYVHFFPHRSPAATKEYAALKTLQELKLPAVRPVALLSGLRFGDRKGDAVLTAGVEPAVRVDEALTPADHATARDGIVQWLAALKIADLSHADLRPSSFLLASGRVLLIDALGIVTGRLTPDHLMQFAAAAGEMATVGDRVRAWRTLFDADGLPPVDDRPQRRFRRDDAAAAVERITVGAWDGRILSGGHADEWSAASRLFVTAADWTREWPRVLESLRGDALDVLKRDASGVVMAATVTLAGAPVDVIVKRPQNKFLYRYALDLFRWSRAWRTWANTRRLLVRHVAVERPLAIFERRIGLYALEAVGIYERVPGRTLEAIDLDALDGADRETLFRRCGRALRRIEATGLANPDAKSSNWIVFRSATRGPVPVIIDAYGLRALTRPLQGVGLKRLLRAMKQHPQYTPTDSLHLCQGFVPRATPEADDAR